MSRSSRGRTALGTLVAIATMACGAAPPLEQLSQARDLSADLLVQFVSAADASNKVIMADTNEAAAAFARDAQRAKNGSNRGPNEFASVLRRKKTMGSVTP